MLNLSRWSGKNLCCNLRKASKGKFFSTSHASFQDPFKILFLGRDEFSCIVLMELWQARDVWDRIQVVTTPDERTGRRGSHLSVSPLKVRGKLMELPVETIPQSKPDFKHWKPPEPFSNLGDNDPPLNHVIITASFGRILPSRILNLFAQSRRLNVHPSLLPAYRGAAPIQHAILSGERETGVCIIEMLKRSEGIDAGPIWASTKIPLKEGHLFESLRNDLAVEGGRLLVSVLRDMIAGEAKSVPQTSASDSPRAPLINFQDSVLDFTTMTAESICRRHNAIAHQRPLTSYLPLHNKSLQIHSPTVALSAPSKLSSIPGTARYHKPTRCLMIRCSDGSVIQVPKVKQEGKALLDARDWWNGAESLGMVLKGEVRFFGTPQG